MQLDANKSTKTWVKANRFTVLLCALALMVFAGPVAKALRGDSPVLFSRLLVLGCFVLMLFSALFAISRSHRQLAIAAILAVPAVVLHSINSLRPNDQIGGWGYAFTILFLGYIITLIIVVLFQQRSIDANLICASLCAYLLLGLCWAFVYSLIEIMQPDSFSISTAHSDITDALSVSGPHSGFAVYYSFVTLSTLGYGDVIPVTPIARVFSYGEAVIGQLYLAVLVARLVGLHISQSMGGQGEVTEVS